MTKLYRSNRDKMFTGLIGGISDYFGIESTLLRIIFVVSVFFSGGTLLLIYLIASLVVPKEPYYHDPYGPPQGRHGGGYRSHDHRGPGPGYNSYNDGYGRQNIRTNMDNSVRDMTGRMNPEAMGQRTPIWMQ